MHFLHRTFCSFLPLCCAFDACTENIRPLNVIIIKEKASKLLKLAPRVLLASQRSEEDNRSHLLPAQKALSLCWIYSIIRAEFWIDCHLVLSFAFPCQLNSACWISSNRILAEKKAEIISHKRVYVASYGNICVFAFCKNLQMIFIRLAPPFIFVIQNDEKWLMLRRRDIACC